MEKHFTLNRPEGDIVLPFLSPACMVDLISALRKERKERVRENCAIAGFAGVDLVGALNSVDKVRIEYADLLKWMETFEGQYATICASLTIRDSKPAGRAEFDALGLKPMEFLVAAAGVANLQLVPIVATTTGGTPPPLSGGEPASPT